MLKSKLSLLYHQFTTVTIFLLCLCALPTFAAEEEVVLLTIEGNLIDTIPSIDSSDEPAIILRSYYELLPDAVHAEIETLSRQLTRLVPDYNVAFTAADSAEITQVRTDIDLLWATLQSILSQHFTQEVVALLNSIYNTKFPLLDAELPQAKE